MSSVRSSKNSSSFLTGVATPIDIATVPFIGKVERADVYSSISTVIDLLPAALQPGVTGGVVSAPISAGGTGYSGGGTGTLVGAFASNATYTISGQNGGAVTSVVVTNRGSGYVPGETLELNPNSGGGSGAKATMISELHDKAIELQIFESPCDPTDSTQFPDEPGAVAGGGLAPTQTQLDKYFNQQFDAAPKLTYSDQTPRTSQCLGITAVTQSYVVVKASAVGTPGMQLQCRVESYLYKDAQPLVTTDAGGAAPPAPATEGTLSAVRDAAEVVSKCVNTSNNHLKVDIANDTLSGAIDVALQQDGSIVGSGNPLHVGVSVSALPSGAATSDKQTAANTSLADAVTKLGSIDGKVAACDTANIAGTVDLKLGGSAVAVANPIPFYRPAFVKTFGAADFPAAQYANRGLSTGGTGNQNAFIFDLGTPASKNRLCMKWNKQISTSDDMVVKFILSMGDSSSATDLNGLVQYATDGTTDLFYGEHYPYMSVNINLGHTPRFIYMQAYGQTTPTANGVGVMDNLEVKFYCEQ